jgi:glycosyltransferase involved in cell wall biosynthesis
MNSHDDLDSLRREIALLKRKSTKTSWILRQLGRKIVSFPRDFSRRLRNSVRKRVTRRRGMAVAATPPSLAAQPQTAYKQQTVQKPKPADGPPFIIHDRYQAAFDRILASDPASVEAVKLMGQFRNAPDMEELTRKAAELEPHIGALHGWEESYCAPWHDLAYIDLRKMTTAVPRRDYMAVVLMPAGRLGGADLVAGLLARSLTETGRVLVLRTDDSEWERPDWFRGEIDCVDISGLLKATNDPRKLLYALLIEIGAPRVFNLNSLLGFETFAIAGPRLAAQFKIYAYFFCSDIDEAGVEVGYPVWFFSRLLPHLTGALFDTADLRDRLADRFQLSQAQRRRLHTLYTPAQAKPETAPANAAVEPATDARPLVLWAGRFDRQKRFDLLVEVARRMPDVDFRCWGKAVLDRPPDLSRLPANLTINAPFRSYADLPLAECQAWLYTAAWDGLPTILIDLGAHGVPIVASAVGGVPELIDERTGWPVFEIDDPDAYVAALRDALRRPEERRLRALHLRDLVETRHTVEAYVRSIKDLEAVDAP